MESSAAARHERERAFHNEAFSAGTRNQVSKFYQVIGACRAGFEALLAPGSPGQTALEYGCGPGRYASYLAARYGSVFAIDISEVAIQQAREDASRRGLHNVRCEVMDAEALQFDDATFDLICGVAILHHLDLDKAFAEIARTLKPSGRAVFMEPLGHNPLINWYRRRTPHLRTPDEHPLMIRDLQLANRYFRRVEHQFYTLHCLLAVPALGWPGFAHVLRALEATDRVLFRLLPAARKYAWQVITVLSEPVAAESRNPKR
jgi:SAM-dependent methyltransferase